MNSKRKIKKKNIKRSSTNAGIYIYGAYFIFQPELALDCAGFIPSLDRERASSRAGRQRTSSSSEHGQVTRVTLDTYYLNINSHTNTWKNKPSSSSRISWAELLPIAKELKVEVLWIIDGGIVFKARKSLTIGAIESGPEFETIFSGIDTERGRMELMLVGILLKLGRELGKFPSTRCWLLTWLKTSNSGQEAVLE